MMRNFFFIILLFSLTSHETDSAYHTIKSDTSSLLNLKWNKAYPDDSIDKSIIGLKWALSYMGATLPASNSGFSNTDSVITIDLQKIGLPANAFNKLRLLSDKIKATPEYKITNAIDLGRYICQLIGASEHYYAILGTPKKLSHVLKNYTFLPQKGYVDNSGVSLEHRIIRFSEQNGFNQLFLAEEIDSVSGKIHEYETIELLANGQLRFGIFDAEGNRKNNAEGSHSNAGKPAKCMWCHESNIQPIFYPLKDFPGYLDANGLKNTLANYRKANLSRKTALKDGVDFSQTQQHTLTELLYISFMEPSAERLSLEWNIPIDRVAGLLSKLPTHTYGEFPFLGTLYHRRDVERLAPFQGLQVSGDVREQSAVEVNHLN